MYKIDMQWIHIKQYTFINTNQGTCFLSFNTINRSRWNLLNWSFVLSFCLLSIRVCSNGDVLLDDYTWQKYIYFYSIIGTSQVCTQPRGRFFTNGDLFLNLNHLDQVCIRCLFDGINLQPDTIYTVIASGITLNDSLPDVTINADGSMILDNPGNYLSNEDSFTCSSGVPDPDTVSFIITARQICKWNYKHCRSIILHF